MEIKVEYTGLGKRLYELLSIAKEVNFEIERMEEVFEELGIFWDSDAQGEYAIRVTADLYNSKAILRKICVCLKELAGLLKRFDEAEMKVSEMVLSI